MKKQIVILMTLLQSIGSFSQCIITNSTKHPIGAGLGGLVDWARTRTFNDAFKCNRGLVDINYPAYQYHPVATDALGWPIADFSTIIMYDLQPNEAGVYKLSFNGKATLGGLWSNCNIANQVYNSTTNVTTADIIIPSASIGSVTPGSSLNLSFTNTSYTTGVSGIKNIKLLCPQAGTSTATFRSDFLTHNQRFNTIRFMDWRNTNFSKDSLWANRTKYTDPSFTQTGKGVAWEYCIELSNTLKKDMWINIPHKADSNYIAQLALLIKTKLDPSLNVYIEHSNEVWNSGFEQFHYNYQQANIEANKPNSVLNYDNINDLNTWSQRRHAKKCKDISDIFKSVWGASAINTRVRVLLGQQLGWFEFSQRGIEFLKNKYGAPSNYLYGLTIAPYFSISTVVNNQFISIDSLNSNLSVNQINTAMASTADSLMNCKLNNWMIQYKARAEYYNLHLLAYEGGPDTFGPNNLVNKVAATRSVTSKNTCYKYLLDWFNYGLEQFNWFVSGWGIWEGNQYGTYALTENNEYSQKLRAIDSVLNKLPTTPNVGTAMPGFIDTRQDAGFGPAWTNSLQNAVSGAWRLPYFSEYLIRVPQGQGGNYQMIIEAGANVAGNSFEVWIDDVFIQTVTPTYNSNFYGNTIQLPDYSPICIYLPDCLHTIRLKYTQTNLFIGKIKITNSNCNTSGIFDANLLQHGLNLFPNPSNGKFSVIIETKQTATVTNCYGEIIQNLQLQNGENNLDFSDLANGIYFLNTKNTRNKFIIIH